MLSVEPFQNFAQQRADKIKERRMTDQTTEQSQQAEPAFVPVAANATERLAQLHASYAEAKAAADGAAERLADVKDAIKAELMALAPEGSTKIALTGPDGPTLTLVHAESWRVDSRKLKAEDPETYVRYAKKSESWTLAAAKGSAQGGASQ